MSELSAQAIEYIEKSSVLLLVTVDKENKPSTRYVGPYVNNGLNIFFMTMKDSRKVKHINGNPFVSLYIQLTEQPAEKFKSVGVSGRAMLVGQGAEFDDIFDRIGQKSPGFKNWLLKDGLDKWVVCKVTAASLHYTDFSKSKKTMTEEI
jgi:uncharacterized protein